MFSSYDELQVEDCYFCQPWKPTSTPSIPQCRHQDGLFLLFPNEKPLCAADALLLFCIDISGSMSTTSQVKAHNLTLICLLAFTNTICGVSNDQSLLF